MSARRWLFGFFALMVLGVLGWFGWEQYQLRQRQAAAPVISIAEDGTVRINGREILIGADSLPLDDQEGGLTNMVPYARAKGVGSPPQEPPPVMLTPSQEYLMRWIYPGTDLGLYINVNPGYWPSSGSLMIGLDSPGTLEFRGQRWWLGQPGPFGGIRPQHVAAIARAGEKWAGTDAWSMPAGDTLVVTMFDGHSSRLGKWLGTDPLRSRPLQVYVSLSLVPTGSSKRKPSQRDWFAPVRESLRGVPGF